jgi:molecular chaperone GrpE (heat shock protein)
MAKRKSRVKDWEKHRRQLIEYLRGCTRRDMVEAAVTLLRRVRDLAEKHEALEADCKGKLTEIARLDGQIASLTQSRARVMAERENLRRRLERTKGA